MTDLRSFIRKVEGMGKIIPLTERQRGAIDRMTDETKEEEMEADEIRKEIINLLSPELLFELHWMVKGG